MGNDCNLNLDALIKERLNKSDNWVLIGGPPCQAYSLVGRARNKGISEYKAEDDHRHFLYKEYLRIIKKFRSTVFVMENVKRILSSRIDGDMIFHLIYWMTWSRQVIEFMLLSKPGNLIFKTRSS